MYEMLDASADPHCAHNTYSAQNPFQSFPTKMPIGPYGTLKGSHVCTVYLLQISR